jgi:DNA-binding response OmpR family regulator
LTPPTVQEYDQTLLHCSIALFSLSVTEEFLLPRILVIEDHKKLLRSLQRGLTAAGYDVLVAETGEAGYYIASTDPIDAIVLDLMLPGRDGLEVLRDLRKMGFSAPVVILSARDTVADRVAGLNQGADDYLVKPFAFEELIARIQAQLNRPLPGRRLTEQAGDLVLDHSTHTVQRAGREIDLSKLEYRLLEYLLRHKNETVSRTAIARHVWGEPQGTNVVEVYINALRKKIDQHHPKKLIETVRGAGYMLSDAAEESVESVAEAKRTRKSHRRSLPIPSPKH